MDEVTNCAACGGSIVKPVGRWKEFCSEVCQKQGRAFCKSCGASLQQPSKARRFFCNPLCRSRYYQTGTEINPSFLEELSRSTCKTCGGSITQNHKGNIKQFCSERCASLYRYTGRHGIDVHAKWGMYGPLTRKVIHELEDVLGQGAAQRLATAIDREYVLRKRKDDSNNIRGGSYSTHRCKACGKEFRRRLWGHQSKEYCSSRCIPTIQWEHGKGRPAIKLSWEVADEIRKLYATGDISLLDIGKMYGVTKGNIHRIVKGKTWKPEHDPRRKQLGYL